MYLKQLEIHGFKSFAEKIELSFGNTINAIVGPNGSGKSNISDAIRWVLGEQSVKALRGSRMEDVIFAGSDSEKALGFAEVSLCIDNSDRKIPVDFTEINIMRRMYRSGESEYFINKTNCRLKDIYEFFMDTGIGRDGYSIIGQGRIDEILSNKSEDRRNVFEEAAGIVKYKTRKHEAEKKLEQTNQNIVRITDIIEELQSQLGPLKEQAEVAKRYRSILEELKAIEINIMLSSIDKHRSKLLSVKQEAEGIQGLLNEKSSAAEQLEHKQSELRILLNEVEICIDELSEHIHQLENIKEKMEGECNVLQVRINNLDENSVRLKERGIELEDELVKSRLSIEQNSKKLIDLNTAFNEVCEKINERTADFESNFEAINSMESDLNDKQQKFINLINNYSELKSKINSANTFIENINKRKSQVEGDVNLLELQQKDKNKQYDRSVEELEDFSRKIEDCKDQIEEWKGKKQECESAIQVLEDTAGEVKAEKETLSSRLKALEDMERDHGGYSRAVKVIMTEYSRITKGFCGVVGEMIKVPSQYVTAIEVALGGSVQSIITNTENDAKLLIEYLKEHRTGRATFLPISSVKPRFFNGSEKQLFGIEGFVGIASELIGYDKKVDPIMKNLLGRTAVVADIDSAIKLARKAGYEYKIVTLAGEVINTGGSITGGSLQSSSSSVLSRKSEIETLKAKHSEKHKELEELDLKLAELKEQAAGMSGDIEFKTEILHSLQIDINNYRNRCDNLKNDIQVIQDRISINIKDIKDLDKEYNETHKIITENKEKAECVEKEKSDIEAQISELQDQMKQFKEIRDEYNDEITELKIKLASVEHNKKTLESSVKSTEERIREIEEEIGANKAEIETQETEMKVLTKEFEDKKASIDRTVLEASEKQKLHNDKEKEKSAISEDLEKLEADIKGCGNDIAALQTDIHKNEMQYTRAEMELESIEMKLLETYEMNYNKAQEYRDPGLSLTWAAKHCEELKNDIREMGTVNVNAIEEFDKLRERHSFLSTQVGDLSKARDNLISVITEIEDNMKLQFITEFNKINENFNQVFKQLFGGGHAELVLTDENDVLESGIEIIAKPPGKKLQNLLLLSGGERALTAIALLFGILKMKPAPFCVLDEIDAALDDANVDRFAEFLVNFSVTTQFIVVTHRKGTMECADCLYGVSMEDSGISRLVSVRLEDKVS
ncbi:MAG: chromosome segregation protein SMC [Clostridiaceae bacterium]|nr:chromosome segregation protein SMC [Clostridiaceae bacterium]